jgi:outer membrane receptor for ferric coprogen and ferric-rhodotorulic acid
MPVRKIDSLVAVICASAAAMAHGETVSDADDTRLETVLIIGQRDARNSKGATGLDLSLIDTPQSVSVLNRNTLDAFALDEINDVLRFAPGVNVEASETDRTYYNSRGFDITSMQIDGVGMPFDSLVVGALDTALYEKVEIIRGANGLLTGVGNPSGTVNFVRKRPTNNFMASAELSIGSWNRKRLEADVSTPLVDSGRWAARVVAAVDDEDSWLNLYHNKRQLFYGIVDGQLGDRFTLTAGFSQQDNYADGASWGAVPYIYGDGTQGDFDVSTNTAMNWTYWDTHAKSAFAELGMQVSNDWLLKTTLTYSDYDEPSELFYVYVDPQFDAETGMGIKSNPGKFDAKSHSLLSDSSVSGDFELSGQQHQATLGLSIAKLNRTTYEFAAQDGFEAMPSFPGWIGDEVARPDFAEGALAAHTDIYLNRLYGASRLSITDTLKFIAGFSEVDYDSKGASFGVASNASERAFSPYIGATWRIIPALNVYASYSDLYQPQYVIGSNFQPLGAAKGKSYEAGIKGEWFHKQLLTTLAVFKAEQDNLAEFATYSDGDDVDDADTSDDFAFAFYKGIAVRSEGFELEIAGKLLDSLDISAGYTHMTLEAPDGSQTRTFIPRSSLKLLANWQLPWLSGVALGASARWQDRIYIDTSWGRMHQQAYAVLDLHGSYQFTDNLRVGVNFNNASDKKYLSSLQWDQAFYGAPRNYSAQLSWKY